ncbi:hypothetical protein KKA27_01660 [Patescibacteria group bacterium]|nr:hypothetical protein [Patescibacteria group bacterium]MBU2633438.1 hypothetical protein [Patescibacteria group bacterium]
MNIAFLFFNGAGFIISISAIVIIAHTAISLTGLMRKKVFSLFRGFIFIALSFAWSLFFNFLMEPTAILNIQSVLLAFGMAMLIYSANKIFEIYEQEKLKLETIKNEI